MILLPVGMVLWLDLPIPMSTKIASFLSQYGTFEVVYDEDDEGPLRLQLTGESVTIVIGFVHNSFESHAASGEYCKGIFTVFDAFLDMHRFETKYEIADNIRSPSKFKDAYLRFIIERWAETYKLRRYAVPGGKDQEIYYIPLDTESESSDPDIYMNDYICAIQTPYAVFKMPIDHPERKFIVMMDKPRELERELAFIYTRTQYEDAGSTLIQAASFRYLMECIRQEIIVIAKYRAKAKLPLLLGFMDYISGNDSIRLAINNRVATDAPR